MKTSAAMENLWLYLQSLPRSNKQWLADRLIEDLQPHVEEDRVEYISKEEVLAGIDAGLKELKLMREGKLNVCSAEDFLEELRDGD